MAMAQMSILLSVDLGPSLPEGEESDLHPLATDKRLQWSILWHPLLLTMLRRVPDMRPALLVLDPTKDKKYDKLNIGIRSRSEVDSPQLLYGGREAENGIEREC